MKMVSTRNRFKFFEGEKVLCYEPDPTKAKVLYDSKVLEVCVSKESRGRKIPEYLIHFSGWSTTWDRYVTEEFILKDNEENRILQCRLAEAAAAHLKSKKQKRKLSEILNNSAISKRKLYTDVEVDDWKGSTESNTSHSAASSTATASEDENKEEDKSVELPIPNLLKKKLEEDYLMIKKEKKLVKLPCEPNVISVLEGYVKTYAANALCGSTEKSKDIKNREQVERSIGLCKEVMDGLRIYFDFTLPLLLLYNEEKLQFEEATNSYKPPVMINADSPSKRTVTEIKVEVNDSTIDLDAVPAETLESASPTKSEQSQISPGSRHAKHHPVESPASPQPAKSTPQRTPKPERLEELFGFAELEVPKRVLRSSGKISDTPTSPPPTEGNRMCSPRSDDEHVRRSGGLKEVKCVKNTGTRKQQQHSPRQTAAAAGTTRTGSSNRVSSPSAVAPETSSCGSQLLDVTPTHGRRVQPPPPLNISSHISSSSSSRSGPSTPTTGVNPNSSCEVTNALNETMSWRMIPSYVYHQKPAPPSVIYGIQHLLRLFVKLPEMITRTNMPVHKLKVLLEHLELFLHYLDNQHEDFFHNFPYIETPTDLKLSTSTTNLPSDSVIQR